MSRISPNALVSAVVRIRAMDLTQKEQLADELFHAQPHVFASFLVQHANHSMAGHYTSADVGRLLKQANLILDRRETRTVLRVANGPPPGLWIKDPAEVRQPQTGPRLHIVSP